MCVCIFFHHAHSSHSHISPGPGKYSRQLEGVDEEIEATREALEREGDEDALEQFEDEDLLYARVRECLPVVVCVFLHRNYPAVAVHGLTRRP